MLYFFLPYFFYLFPLLATTLASPTAMPQSPFPPQTTCRSSLKHQEHLQTLFSSCQERLLLPETLDTCRHSSPLAKKGCSSFCSLETCSIANPTTLQQSIFLGHDNNFEPIVGILQGGIKNLSSIPDKQKQIPFPKEEEISVQIWQNKSSFFHIFLLPLPASLSPTFSPIPGNATTYGHQERSSLKYRVRPQPLFTSSQARLLFLLPP